MASHRYGYEDVDLKWHVVESCEGNTHNCMVFHWHGCEDAVLDVIVDEIVLNIPGIRTAANQCVYVHVAAMYSSA